jgi:Ca2+-binding EF-hand superfamily protein
MGELGPEARAELQGRFAQYDADGDGRIGFDEFCELLGDLDEDLSRDECLLAFAATDSDDDGSIGFEEFALWWTAA